MAITNAPWEFHFCAAYIVPACKGMDEKHSRAAIDGSPIDPTALPMSYFLPQFCKSVDKYPIGVIFSHENGKQINQVRSLLLSIISGTDDEKADAASVLACRLAMSTDKRSTRNSELGLFIVLAGCFNDRQRVLLWKFPAGPAIQARTTSTGITIELLKDTFMEQHTYFKAAVFDGTLASTDFWVGRVEDRQARSATRGASELWVNSFLSARLECKGAAGSLILARALRETIKKTKSLLDTETLIDAASVIMSKKDKVISLSEFASEYLPTDYQGVFLKLAGGSDMADVTFQVDPDTIARELRVKSLVLDNSYVIRGPSEIWDSVVKAGTPDESGILDITIRGKIVSVQLLQH